MKTHIRAWSDLFDARRIIGRMEAAWSTVPSSAFAALAREMIRLVPNFTNDALHNSIANNIFQNSVGRGNRYFFHSASLEYASTHPNLYLIIVQIERRTE